MDSQYENLTTQYSAKPDGYYEGGRTDMLPFIPLESSSILEIGCGSGAFGSLIKKERPGVVVWGIEPDKGSAELAAKRLDNVVNSVFSGNMTELDGKLFDVICMNDVLEHLVNPELALEDCKAHLAPAGIIVASIPNILFLPQILQILLRQDWKYEDAGIMDNTHLRFFTKKSIIRMFESQGYEILKIEGLDPNLGFMAKVKFTIAKILTLGHVKDWKHIQFAVQARVRRPEVQLT